MQNDNHSDEIDDLLATVDLTSGGLPNYTFSKHFRRHLFFDSDICASCELIGAVKEIARICIGPEGSLAIFSASMRSFLGWIELVEDWPSRIGSIVEVMRRAGDYGGLQIVDATGRLAIYQARPVDMGVFAFDGEVDWKEVPAGVREGFVDSQEIQFLLDGDSERATSAVDNFGREFLQRIAENYGSVDR